MLTCTQRNLDIHLPGYMINIRTPVSHDFFAQVPLMFIFLQHKQFFEIQEKRGRCGLLWVSPYQTPIVCVGKPASCNPVRHRLKEVTILMRMLSMAPPPCPSCLNVTWPRPSVVRCQCPVCFLKTEYPGSRSRYVMFACTN